MYVCMYVCVCIKVCMVFPFNMFNLRICPAQLVQVETLVYVGEGKGNYSKEEVAPVIASAPKIVTRRSVGSTRCNRMCFSENGQVIVI